jgi:hypothetical protein
MYCKKCYAALDPSAQVYCCWNCEFPFDPANRRTYLARPFPSTGRVIWYIVLTSVLSVAGAFVVAFFQAAGASGH